MFYVLIGEELELVRKFEGVKHLQDNIFEVADLDVLPLKRKSLFIYASLGRRVMEIVHHLGNEWCMMSREIAIRDWWTNSVSIRHQAGSIIRFQSEMEDLRQDQYPVNLAAMLSCGYRDDIVGIYKSREWILDDRYQEEADFLHQDIRFTSEQSAEAIASALKEHFIPKLLEITELTKRLHEGEEIRRQNRLSIAQDLAAIAGIQFDALSHLRWGVEAKTGEGVAPEISTYVTDDQADLKFYGLTHQQAKSILEHWRQIKTLRCWLIDGAEIFNSADLTDQNLVELQAVAERATDGNVWWIQSDTEPELPRAEYFKHLSFEDLQKE